MKILLRITSVFIITTIVSSSKSLVLRDYKQHPCVRDCNVNGDPMICKYHFTVKDSYVLSKACKSCPFNVSDCDLPNCISANGIKRPVTTVNGEIPGYHIQVCQNDELVVDVENNLLTEATSIHWHGMLQYKTPYMDGAPFVTQCPIQPYTTFRYRFIASEAGTHFWHSHSGFQRVDGVVGPLIVKSIDELNPYRHLYDYDLSDHVMIIFDWADSVTSEIFSKNAKITHMSASESILVNGRGRYRKFYGKNNATYYTPTARFIVEKGKRYRMRIIHAGFRECPIEISIENHTLLVFNSDGNDFKPVEVDFLTLYNGERFDIVLNAFQKEGLYWFRFKGYEHCRRFPAFQVAVLQYSKMSNESYPAGNPSYNEPTKPGILLNPTNQGSDKREIITIPELISLLPKDDALKEEADLVQFLVSSYHNVSNSNFQNNKTFPPQINNISFTYLSFPFLSQRDQLQSSMFCNDTTVKDCSEHYCGCAFVLQVALNSVIELILLEQARVRLGHSFHLHGQKFRVIAMGNLKPNETIENFKKSYIDGQIKKNLISPPVKDSVGLEPYGYTVIRFKASNPGYWLFHCHVEFHQERGMLVLFKVGNHSEMVSVPKNFPTCNNYMPDL